MLDRAALYLQLCATYDRLDRQIDTSLSRGDRCLFVQAAMYRNGIIHRLAGLTVEMGEAVTRAYSPASEIEDDCIESV